MEDQNFCSEWVTFLYPNVLYNVLYECLFIINNFIIIIIIIIIIQIPGKAESGLGIVVLETAIVKY